MWVSFAARAPAQQVLRVPMPAWATPSLLLLHLAWPAQAWHSPTSLCLPPPPGHSVLLRREPPPEALPAPWPALPAITSRCFILHSAQALRAPHWRPGLHLQMQSAGLLDLALCQEAPGAGLCSLLLQHPFSAPSLRPCPPPADTPRLLITLHGYPAPPVTPPRSLSATASTLTKNQTSPP